jgi:molecular chaperone DnaJ
MALGGEIDIPTLDGHAKIKIPQETQRARCFARAIRGYGRCAARCRAISIATSRSKLHQAHGSAKRTLARLEAINQQDPDAHSPRAKSF